MAQFLAVREMDPKFPRTYMIDAVYEQKGLFAAALTNVEKLMQYRDSAWTLAELVYLYSRSGQQGQAKHALDKLQELNRREQVEPATLLLAYVGLGDKDQAFIYLEKAFSQHSNALRHSEGRASVRSIAQRLAFSGNGASRRIGPISNHLSNPDFC